MALLRSLAHRLALTGFGRKSLNKPDGQFSIKEIGSTTAGTSAR
ncbi:MAG: hypothetical protein PHS17_16500 [Desulfobacterales bacterium]|nr:hypothetical protein [Desulfobacterales bacterium]